MNKNFLQVILHWSLYQNGCERIGSLKVSVFAQPLLDNIFFWQLHLQVNFFGFNVGPPQERMLQHNPESSTISRISCIWTRSAAKTNASTRLQLLDGPFKVVQMKADRILLIGLDQILKMGCSKGKEGI